jgi:type II secretory pathway pseudopilin PulG
MVGLVAAIAILMIFSAVGGQAWKERLRRENEAEMMFRAQEISRAILRFQKAQGRLPLKLEDLMEPGPQGQYFLRRPYEDPLVRSGEWGLLFQAPGGGILDPNAPAPEEEIPVIAISTSRPIDPAKALAPTLQGQQPTGLPIVGVKSLATERPFRVYRGQRDYALWQFTLYDYQPQAARQPGTPQVPAGAPGGRPRAPGDPVN